MAGRNFFLVMFCAFFLGAGTVFGQAQLAPWGNLQGIRLHGQLFNFESSITVLNRDGLRNNATGKERQRPIYTRDDKTQVVNTNMDSLYIREAVKDEGSGKITVMLRLTSKADTVTRGVFFCISLPGNDYDQSKIRLSGATQDILNIGNRDVSATGVSIKTRNRSFDIKFEGNVLVSYKRDSVNGINNTQLYFRLLKDTIRRGDYLEKSFSINVDGDIDETPVNIAVDITKQGSPFDGFGGNFRLQNPKFDPQVIDYCLNNMRVAWGRVEMPWRFWQPQIDVVPTDSAKQNPAVKQAMAMAARLNKQNIPIILSAWVPPTWAIAGSPNFRPVKGVWGNPLNYDNIQSIYKSITDYIIYLKTYYDVEVKYFSFNESDLGINIRVTAQEHDNLITGLGAYFSAHGVKTKMLLGDNSDATTYKFIYPTLNDAAAQRYIGAVSFHSWRGWDTETLEKWALAAKQANVPLIVGEGSTDAQAWGYPEIFREPSYALQEINLYTRLLNICQPLTILQWQLTSDYSPLVGGGLFGNNEQPLHPEQRFFNLKQLASTPAHLFALPVTCSTAGVSCAALGDKEKGIYTIHLVNNESAKDVIITGLPPNLRVIHVYLTNENSYMKDVKQVKNENGKLTFKMKQTSYYTIICGNKTI